MVLRFLLLIFLLGFDEPVFAADSENRVRRNVEIEWEQIPGATIYEIRIKNKNEPNKKPLLFKTKELIWSATIKAGTYNMQLRAYDDRGVPGSWSEGSELIVKLPAVIPIKPETNKKINGSEEQMQNVDFKWETVPDAEKYLLKLSSADGSWTYEKEISENVYSVEVPVAKKILWNVVAIDGKGDAGDVWKDNESFHIYGPPLVAPKLEKPMSMYLREIHWQPTELAESYRYKLNFYNRKNKKWELVESNDEFKQTTLPLDASRPSGTYRLLVSAQSDSRAESTFAKLDFKMKGGFRTPASLDTAILRDSITKPTNFYFIASYFATQVQYEFDNYDTATRSSFDALGAVGRIGLGYQNPKSKWGAFGIVDISALAIGGKTYNFTSMEIHGTRTLRVGNSGQFLMGAGVYSRDIPVLVGSTADGFSDAGKVSTMGSHVGFIYWVPLSDRYGLQTNGRVYYSLSGSAPVGGIEPTMSYQMGLLGSYRIGSSWMGYAGYAYRLDHVEFDTSAGSPASFAQPSQRNEVNFKGHFLNLIFEYSF